MYSTAPNIQGAGRRIRVLLTDRDLILAEPGEVLIGADLSGIDARAVAGLSGDPAYAALFEPDRDIHAEGSLMWFGDTAHREQAKAINHGLTNGQGARSIAADTGLPVDDVQNMITAHFKQFPGVAAWQAKLRADAEQGRPLATGTGRWAPSDPGRAYTTAPARAGQACARDLFVTGLFRLHRYGFLKYLRLALHDEVVLSVPEVAAKNVLEFVVELMSFDWKSPSGLVIPIVAVPATGSGPRWSDLYRVPAVEPEII
jgi:DNA polymerase-1